MIHFIGVAVDDICGGRRNQPMLVARQGKAIPVISLWMTITKSQYILVNNIHIQQMYVLLKILTIQYRSQNIGI